MSFGKRLMNLRIENNLSQEAVAEKLDVSDQTLRRWEQDKSFPDVARLKDLCKLFNVSADYFISEETDDSFLEEDIPLNPQEDTTPVAQNFKGGGEERQKGTVNRAIVIALIVTLVIAFINLTVSCILLFDNFSDHSATNSSNDNISDSESSFNGGWGNDDINGSEGLDGDEGAQGPQGNPGQDGEDGIAGSSGSGNQGNVDDGDSGDEDINDGDSGENDIDASPGTTIESDAFIQKAASVSIVVSLVIVAVCSFGLIKCASKRKEE